MATTASPFAALGIRGLANLFEAYHSAHDAFTATYNKLRPTPGQGQDELHNEIERCDAMMEAMAAEIANRQPDNREDQRERGEILIRWGLMTGDWTDIGITFVQAVGWPCP